MNKSIIIDASVVAKWLLPDEANPIADLIKEDFAKRIISIAVPAFIFYEVNCFCYMMIFVCMQRIFV